MQSNVSGWGQGRWFKSSRESTTVAQLVEQPKGGGRWFESSHLLALPVGVAQWLERPHPLALCDRVFYRSVNVAKKEPEKGRKPDMVIRARQSGDSDFFITLGVAWEVEVSGQKAYSIKMQCVPIGWDGSALMMVPKTE